MKRKLIDYILLVFKGIAMGIADVIPGVSGGTIALITGIYEELVDSIKSIGSKSLLLLFKKNGISQFFQSINAKFIFSVVLGIIISFLTLSRLMQYLLNFYPIFVWSFFFGLIMASIWFVGKTVKKWNLPVYISFVVGIIIGFWITIISPTETTNELWFIFLSGSIAICAMILPGISGSFILLLLGKYAYMMGALSSFNLPIIIVFLAGAVIGILLFSNVLSWLLHHFHNITISVLAGFMLGSLNKVWPWKISVQTFIDQNGIVKPLIEKNVLPETFKYTNGLEPYTLWAILFALLGVIVIVLLERITIKKESDEDILRQKLGF
jgi:putative membrane protein